MTPIVPKRSCMKKKNAPVAGNNAVPDDVAAKTKEIINRIRVKITGPRQVGKMTVLKECDKSRKYVSIQYASEFCSR